MGSFLVNSLLRPNHEITDNTGMCAVPAELGVHQSIIPHKN